MSKQEKRAGPERDVRRRPANPRHQDNYPHPEKRADALVCTDCGLVWHAGRWHRSAPPLADTTDTVCPACRRIREGQPAGTLVLDAGFLEHKDEVLAMSRNAEEAERDEHPLERLMEPAEDGGRLVLRTTGVHLARRIANKLERRFHRQARFHYSDGEEAVRVDWPA